MYFLMVAVCMKKDLSFFIKFGSFGAFCVTFLITFVIGNGIYALSNTEYKLFLTPSSLTEDDKKHLEISNIWMVGEPYA